MPRVPKRNALQISRQSAVGDNTLILSTSPFTKTDAGGLAFVDRGAKEGINVITGLHVPVKVTNGFSEESTVIQVGKDFFAPILD